MVNSSIKLCKWLVTIFLFLTVITSCENENYKPTGNYFMFPVGRSFINSSLFEITIGDKVYNNEFMFDSCG